MNTRSDRGKVTNSEQIPVSLYLWLPPAINFPHGYHSSLLWFQVSFYLWLLGESPSSPGWLHTHYSWGWLWASSNPPAPISQVVGLQGVHYAWVYEISGMLDKHSTDWTTSPGLSEELLQAFQRLQHSGKHNTVLDCLSTSCEAPS